jgi:hypothetical protein
MVIDEELTARHDNLNRASRQRMGEEINRSFGQYWLNEKAIQRVGDSPCIVVDGLRFPEDHAFLAERFGHGFGHIHIEASDAIRAQRYELSEADGVTFSVADNQFVESGIDALASLSNTIIRNEASITAFEANLKSRVAAIFQGQDHKCLSLLS